MQKIGRYWQVYQRLAAIISCYQFLPWFHRLRWPYQTFHRWCFILWNWTRPTQTSECLCDERRGGSRRSSLISGPRDLRIFFLSWKHPNLWRCIFRRRWDFCYNLFQNRFQILCLQQRRLHSARVPWWHWRSLIFALLSWLFINIIPFKEAVPFIFNEKHVPRHCREWLRWWNWQSQIN